MTFLTKIVMCVIRAFLTVSAIGGLLMLIFAACVFATMK